MKILFTTSEKQQMPSIILALARMGYDVAMYEKPMETLMGSEEEEQELERFLKNGGYSLVISNVFTREAARATNRLGIQYAVWCTDSPCFQAWAPEAGYDNCYLFYFDYRECELKRRLGENAYHQPLAADVARSGSLTPEADESGRYGCDMSFVGGMYTGNMYDRAAASLSPQLQETLMDAIERGAFVWDGQDRPALPDGIMELVRRENPVLCSPPCDMPAEYFFRTWFLCRKLTNVERVLMMDLLARQFGVRLYTWDSERVPESVSRFPAVSPADGALRVFRHSRINLNITLRSIASGVPARVFDVMSAGGFVLSNWQEEIPELFEEGREIVTYRTPEELVDKASYYLKHEEERRAIAANGYRKVRERYTWVRQLEKILAILRPAL